MTVTRKASKALVSEAALAPIISDAIATSATEAMTAGADGSQPTVSLAAENAYHSYHDRPDALQDGKNADQDGEQLPRHSDAANAATAIAVRLYRPRETNHDYPHVLIHDGRRRVIACPGGIQWIVQHLRGNKWKGRGYCRRRETLLRLCRDWSENALDTLHSLPERIEDSPPLSDNVKHQAAVNR